MISREDALACGLLKPGERLDDLQSGGHRLIQRPDVFCFGTDAVLLADFARVGRNARAADLGTGTGAIAMLMAIHHPDLQMDAVELQPELADMARRSAELNALQARVRVHCADLRRGTEFIARQSLSLVVCNPPYSRADGGQRSENAARSCARHEERLTPRELTDAAAALLKFGGRLAVVYPAQRAFEMMCAMQASGLAPKRIRAVHSRLSKPPRLLLMDAVKGGGSMLEWLEPLILYDENGQTTDEWKRIYRVLP